VSCQIAPSVGRLAANAELTLTALRQAVAEGAQLVVLPELASSGYVFHSVSEARQAAQPVDGPLLREWASEAARGGDRVVVVGGFCELGDDGELYNSCALVNGRGVQAVYRKIHLWGAEPRWFVAGGTGAPVVKTALGRVGLAVCYDLEFPELMRGLALAGAELIAIPANWPLDDQRRSMPILASLASVTAYLNRVFVAVCDRSGSERGSEFEGGSVIAGPDGRVLAGGEHGGRVTVVSAVCDLAEARSKRNGELNDAFSDRRPELYEQDLIGRART
jgi:predicted amidohydrolase